MNMAELQQRLIDLGKYAGAVDGHYGPMTRSAILAVMSSGPDTPLAAEDFEHAAESLNCDVAAIKCVRDVEATANPFIDGRPTILFEPHRFSRATGHVFDRQYPRLSSHTWNPALYPASQAGRWTQLLDAVGLNVDAGFASASYGAFQVLGENYLTCGFKNAFEFALAEAQSEVNQLYAFIDFVKVNKLDTALRLHNWSAFARGYNGTAYAQNHYDTRLAQAYEREGGV